ncbi:MAG TPA: hypothetical protein VE466_16280 [Acidimicrobiales bacterium]|nr:hypothetical protein [Acidimicrobiales bacterium]
MLGGLVATASGYLGDLTMTRAVTRDNRLLDAGQRSLITDPTFLD